jgi:hypothetical protein
LTAELAAERDRVVSAARGLFAFLEERGASVEEEESSDMTVIAYIDDQATFEVELDWLEGAAFLLVARTIAGHRPPGYYVSEGRRVRVHLIEALRKAGLLDAPMERRLKDVMKDSGEDGMSSQLKVLAAELRNNLEQLLGRIAVVFS